MLTKEEIIALRERCNKGAEYLNSVPNGWSGQTQPPFDAKRPFNQKKWSVHKAVCLSQKQESCGLTKLQRALCRYWSLWDRFIEYSQKYYDQHPEELQKKTGDAKHSKAWHLMKQQDALIKWKRTLKAKRGPDPRTLPIETFT